MVLPSHKSVFDRNLTVVITMEKATLTIALPRTMKAYIEAKLQEGRFSTPSEYIRSLIRDDQDLTGKEQALWLRRAGTNIAMPSRPRASKARS
jgi:putative addiction module CopG family antidote